MYLKERVRYIFKWLDGSVARQSFSRIKERVRYIFQWLDGSVARQSFSRINERVRYIFQWLDGSVRCSSVAFTDEPPNELNNASLETTDEPPSQLNLYSFKSGPVFCSLADYWWRVDFVWWREGVLVASWLVAKLSGGERTLTLTLPAYF